MAEEQVVVFHLGNEEYCVPIHQVREIIQYQGATKLPGTPIHVEGIINLRGRVIPVIDLAVQLSLAAKSGQRQALIVDLGENNFGIIVDQVSEVLRLADSQLEAAPVQTAGERTYIRGVAKTEDRILIMLELASLVEPAYLKNVPAGGAVT
ncbi:MAG: chemotaxis protein CheW [Negativicutes bacterium]|nr:chemotaxis protein CheW [Negativicutes bacterium]